jgi:hypothetical protein
MYNNEFIYRVDIELYYRIPTRQLTLLIDGAFDRQLFSFFIRLLINEMRFVSLGCWDRNRMVNAHRTSVVAVILKVSAETNILLDNDLLINIWK